MATIATAPRAGLSSERIFFTGMAVALLVFVFAGFAPTYFLLNALHGRTASGFANGEELTPLIHVHALSNSAWMLLLVAGHRPDLHRRLGAFATVLAAAVVISGVATAIVAGQLHHGPAGRNPRAFLIEPLTSIAGFALLVMCGIMWRRRAAYHKRLMILATISMAIPAGARIANMLHSPFVPKGPPGGMLLVDLFVAALVAFDIATGRRVHPATIWAGGAFVLSQPLRMLVGETQAWQSVAALLIG